MILRIRDFQAAGEDLASPHLAKSQLAVRQDVHRIAAGAVSQYFAIAPRTAWIERGLSGAPPLEAADDAHGLKLEIRRISQIDVIAVAIEAEGFADGSGN